MWVSKCGKPGLPFWLLLERQSNFKNYNLYKHLQRCCSKGLCIKDKSVFNLMDSFLSKTLNTTVVGIILYQGACNKC